MKIIVFAGGSGKRFWPASRKNNPKQFQNVVDNKPLLRVKYDYLTKGFSPENIFISTGIAYKNEVEKILPEIPKNNFIYEPAMRDTGPAVLYAVERIFKKYGDAVVSLQWADHYIKSPDIFIKALEQGENIVKQKEKSVIVGVPIRYPSVHRGHIKNGKIIKSLDGEGRLRLAEFKKFVEKPTLEVAKEYIKSGDYTWNTGYFISKTSLIKNKYREFAPDIYEAVISNPSNFPTLEKRAFDYIFAENLSQNEAFVLIAEMGWSDIGEWNSLKEALQSKKNINVKKGNVLDMQSTDCLLYNYEKNKLVSTFDLKDIVVVNTKDVVAVFPKNKTHELKNYLKILEEKGLDKYL